MKVDLHNHTNYSDGVLSPRELVNRAKQNGVDVFALTDHDSVFGDDEIVEIAKEEGIKVIKGMELSTIYDGEPVHIVALFKNNIIPEGILKYSHDFILKRKERAINMTLNINKYYGLNVDVDELVNECRVITRGNILRHVARHNNMTFEEATKYILPDSKAYIPSTNMDTIEGIKFLKDNDCIAIFAHPCLLKKQENVEKILSCGMLDGMEVRYPSRKNDENHFRELAKKYNVFPSAGSDCHGDSTHADIGTCTLDSDEFEIIRKKLML